MKKKLLKFTIIILIFFKGTFSVQANEKVILPKSKPVITKETLASFKVPKKVEFCDLPKTSTGKIQKFELRKKAKELN